MNYNIVVISLFLMSFNCFAMNINRSVCQDQSSEQYRYTNDESPRSVAELQRDFVRKPKCVQYAIVAAANSSEISYESALIVPSCVRNQLSGYHSDDDSSNYDVPVATPLHAAPMHVRAVPCGGVRQRRNVQSSYCESFTDAVVQEDNFIETLCDLVCPCFEIRS